jgi:hypothetical protein
LQGIRDLHGLQDVNFSRMPNLFLWRINDLQMHDGVPSKKNAILKSIRAQAQYV